MRLFVFGIGGTGSKVLTSFVMQLAAGAELKDHNGKLYDAVVPIMVDPHADCDGLKRLNDLLIRYRKIRKSIYGDSTERRSGFFSTKIETLADIDKDKGLSDSFIFNLKEVSQSTFKNFIGYAGMDEANKAMTAMLYDESELANDMKEGFYGSPNIGSVALNEFSNSDDFTSFADNFKSDDRIFFIGSIFGGTGAAGLPLFISNIRDSAIHEQKNLASAPIGALVVMPYFSIATDSSESSEAAKKIDEAEWIVKTRSALDYYKVNLYDKINNTYYISDPVGTTPFVNDPGNVDNQKGNKAHIVEFVGASAIFNFAQSNNIDYSNVEVANSMFYHYGLNTKNKHVTFNILAEETKQLLQKPMMKFHLLKVFMENSLSSELSKPFATQVEPKITDAIMSLDVKEFFKAYDKWIKEMKKHGDTAHNLHLFADDTNTEDYQNLFNDISVKKSKFGISNKNARRKDFVEMLNNNRDKITNAQSMEQRWYQMADLALNEFISDKYELSIK